MIISFFVGAAFEGILEASEVDLSEMSECVAMKNAKATVKGYRPF